MPFPGKIVFPIVSIPWLPIALCLDIMLRPHEYSPFHKIMSNCVVLGEVLSVGTTSMRFLGDTVSQKISYFSVLQSSTLCSADV